jgi:hypothetical protein
MPQTARRGHARPPTLAERWAAFKRSPFLPATVLTLIIAAAAGLFAGTYTYSMANPTPHSIPTAVVGDAQTPRARAFVGALEKALNASVRVYPYKSRAAAVGAVGDQKILAILEFGDSGGRVTVDVAGASGAAVAQLVEQTTPKVGRATGVSVTVRDIRPLQRGDPRGLAVFYISIAAVVIGFTGAVQLSAHAEALTPLQRIVCTATYALLGGFAIVAIVDWLLSALRLPFMESWVILSGSMFTCGMVFTMFKTLFGRWGMLPTWSLMVLIGNPSSGGAVSWALLPSPLGVIGRWLPPGASVNAQHTAIYFPHHQHAFPFIVLAGWSLVSCAVFWVLRHRFPGGRAAEPVPGERAARESRAR